MLAQSGREDQHRQVDALVRRWLQERQSLIVLMMALGDEQRRAIDPTPLSERVQSFSEALMDYVSAGHFEVYDELLAEAESRGADHLAEGKALLQRLQTTTDAVIRFNDLHEDTEDTADADWRDGLAHELSVLGLALEERFEIEDRMIALLHKQGIPAVS